MMLLFPADVLRPRRVDEHFAEEADAARAAGLQVAVVDHDALAAGGHVQQAIARVPAGAVAVYRGWMLDSSRYADLAAALAEREVTLRTDAGQYRRGHELPGWYPNLAPFTPESAWAAGFDRAAFDAARIQVGAGPAVVRDYCKSVKHHWAEAMYIPDLDDAAFAWQIAARMAELRDTDRVGGYVLRRYEQFTGAEARTWWVGGTCRLVTAHPDTADEKPPTGLDVSWLQAAVAALGLPFVTIDLAKRADGVWRIVELGDGQVSDRPSTTRAQHFIDVLAALG